MARAGGRRGRWLFLLLAAILTGTLMALLILQGRSATERARADAERLSQALASGLADQVSRTVETAEVLMVDVRNRRAQGVSPALSPGMAEVARQMPQLRAVAVADASGVIREANVPALLGRDVSDRAWFSEMREAGTSQMRLTPPEPGRMLERIPRHPWPARWTVPLALPLRTASGGFEGAVLVLLNAEYLTAIAQRQADAFGATIRIYDYAGTMLARGDLSLEGIGATHAGAWPFRLFLPRREVGTFTGPDGFGRSVSAGFALTRLAPIVIEVAQESDAVLAGMQEQNTLFLAAIGLLTALALVAAYALMRQGDRLAASEAEARAAGEAKEEFLASMSHEVRTPVSGVIGLSELLLEERLSPVQRSYAETIHASARHLLVLLNDILDFSKLEAGAATPESVPFSIEEQVGTIVELFAPRAAAKGVQLVCLPAPGVPRRVQGDPARFRQVLFNLVGNAVKFTETGWIRVSVSAVTRPDGTRCDVACTVSDTGIGVDPARIPSLFDRFSQADASIRRRYGGSGLGLAISLRLARLMGGTIEAEPRGGGGSVFRFLLTLPTLPAMPDGEDMLPPGLSVLVLEEAGLQRQALAMHLRALGVEAAEAGSLAEAEAMLGARGFDVVVLGRCGDGPDPVEAGTRLRALAAGARLVLFGAAGAEERPAPYGLFQAMLVRPALASRVKEALGHALRRDLAPLEPARPLVAEAEAEPRPGLRLLLAEDNPVNQFMLRRMLEKAGAEVEIAADGRAAVAAAAGRAFDGIIMDLEMPELDGIGATRAIRSGGGPNSATRIVGLTATVGAEHERRCREAGMDAYLTKPADRARLLAALGLEPSALSGPGPGP